MLEDGQADLRAHFLFLEHMHQLEVEEAEKDRIIEEALLALDEECHVPGCKEWQGGCKNPPEECPEAICPTCFGHGGCADCMNEDSSDDYEVPA